MPHSCAFGCKATGVVMHCFPNPKKYPERFKLWVNLVGGQLDTLSENDIYLKKRICDIHFTDEYRNRYKRLNALAVPSLHLPITSKMQLSDIATETQPSSTIPVNPVSVNSYHHFPNPERNPDRFKAWVHIAGGKLHSEADYKLYRKKIICDIHFTDKDRNRNNRLNYLAVPSLHLSGKSDSEVGNTEKVLIDLEPVNVESGLPKLNPTLTVEVHSSLGKHDVQSSDGNSQSEELADVKDIQDELKVCRICLSFNVKMYRIEEYNLCQMLYDITGIKVGENDGIFQNLCWECAARLSAASAFRDKALKSDGMLQRLLSIADTITAYEIRTLKEKHEILQSRLTVQEAFYTTDIAENDPNNMNPNHMDIDDDELDDYYDTSQNYDRTNKLSAAVRTYTSKHYKNEDVVKTYCDVETVGNLTLRERSIKMNHDGSIIIENNKISDQENFDRTDKGNLEEYKNNSKTLEEENLDKVVCCDLSTIEELDRKVIQRFKELKCCQLPELAKEFGLTAEEVQKIFDNAGLKKLPIRKADKQKRKLPLRLNKELKKRVIALKNAGVTVPEIAKQTGVSQSSIYKIWQRWCKENKVGDEMPDNSTARDDNIITQDLSEQNIDKTVLSSAEYIEDR